MWVPPAVRERLFLGRLKASRCPGLSGLLTAVERLAGSPRAAAALELARVGAAGRPCPQHEARWAGGALPCTEAGFGAASRVRGLRGCGPLAGGLGPARVCSLRGGAPFASPVGSTSGRTGARGGRRDGVRPCSLPGPQAGEDACPRGAGVSGSSSRGPRVPARAVSARRFPRPRPLRPSVREVCVFLEYSSLCARGFLMFLIFSKNQLWFH